MEVNLNKKYTAYVSVGSNIGDKVENCKKAIDSIPSSGKSVVKAISNFYRTEPQDYLDQDWFVNAALEVETALNPEELLAELQEIEITAGQHEKEVRFGPRIIDLDIVLFEDLIQENEKITIPHPRMHKRGFVLKPLCDINSKIIHPILQEDIDTLLSKIDMKGQGVHLI